jgi:hypothetical protein
MMKGSDEFWSGDEWEVHCRDGGAALFTLR